MGRISKISVSKSILGSGINFPTRKATLDAERALLEYGSWEEVMPYFFCVDHRDKPGVVAPMVLSPLQKMVSEQVDRALEVELWKLKRISDEGGEVYLPDLKDRMRGLTPKRALETGAINRYEIGLRLLILKSRRGGASTWTLMAAMRGCLLLDGYSAISYAEIDDSTKRIFGIRRFAVDRWREDIHLDRKTAGVGKTTIDKQEFANGSSHIAKTAGSTTRGDKFDFIHLSEYAHYDKLDDVKQAVSVARDHAWIIKESTANGENHFYNDWKGAMTPNEVRASYEENRLERLDRWNGYYRIFFPWWQDPGLKRPITKAQEARVQANLDDYERKLLTDIAPGCSMGHLLFRRERLKDMLKDGELGLSPDQFFNQEYPATPDLAFQSSGRNIFDPTHLDHQLARPYRQVFVDLHPDREPALANVSGLIVYEPPKPNACYIISADLSNGIGIDYNEAICFHRHDDTRFTEVFNIRYNTMSPSVFAWYICVLAYVYNDAYIVGDASGGGIAFNNNLVEKMDWTNIHVRRSTSIENVEENAETAKKYGFWWQPKLKEAMISECRLWLDRARMDDCLVLRSRHGIEQLRAFQTEDNKKFTAPKGLHDDYVSCVLQLLASFKHAPSLDVACNIVKSSQGIRLSVDKSEIVPGVMWDQFIGRIDAQARRNRRVGRIFGVPFELGRE